MVNVIGRFRQIDKDYFLRIARVFEKMCTDNEIDIAQITTFLDGVVQSRLSNSETIVKIVLNSQCPSLIRTIKDVLKQRKSSGFENNYFGLMKSIGVLEILPIEWFEEQAEFLLEEIGYWQQTTRLESSAYLLHTFINLNMIASPNVNKIVEVIFQHLE